MATCAMKVDWNLDIRSFSATYNIMQMKVLFNLRLEVL